MGDSSFEIIIIGSFFVSLAQDNGFFGDKIEFAIGVDLTNTTVLIAILNDTETWDLAQEHGYEAPVYTGSDGYWPDTPWLDGFEGETLATILDLLASSVETEIDSIAGVSITTDGFREAIEIIAQYHIDESIGGAE